MKDKKAGKQLIQFDNLCSILNALWLDIHLFLLIKLCKEFKKY